MTFFLCVAEQLIITVVYWNPKTIQADVFKAVHGSKPVFSTNKTKIQDI